MPTLRERNSAQSWAAVTPHDSTNFPGGPCRGLYVGGAGVVVAVGLDDAVASFTATAGAILPLSAKRVNSTSTTATLIVALY